MSNDTPKITLEDIAERSGVSITTVSRVINASRPVGKATERRVKKVIEELGFTPKKRPSIRTQPATIAFVTEDVQNPASTAMLAGAQDEADKLGMALVPLYINKKHGMHEPSLNLLGNLSLDAIVLMHLQIEPEELRRLYHYDNIPIVLLERIVDSPCVHCIDADRETGMFQAAKYLISLKHSRIGYISCQMGKISEIRLRGVQRALTEAGLSLAPQLLQWGAPSIEGGFQAAGTMLRNSLENPPSAIIVFSDLLAIGAMRAVRAAGFRIPEDISIIGFDNIYFSPYTNPPLTTVSQPLTYFGQLAVRKIYEHLQGYEPNIQGFTFLECPLVVRESTGPCCL